MMLLTCLAHQVCFGRYIRQFHVKPKETAETQLTSIGVRHIAALLRTVPFAAVQNITDGVDDIRYIDPKVAGSAGTTGTKKKPKQKTYLKSTQQTPPNIPNDGADVDSGDGGGDAMFGCFY